MGCKADVGYATVSTLGGMTEEMEIPKGDANDCVM